jgi:hypothetical protein
VSHASKGLERDREAESRRFSGRRAFAHAAAATAVVLVLGIVLAAIVDLEHPQAVGRAIAGMLPVAIGLALLGSYVVQTRSRNAAIGGLLVLAILVAAAVVAWRGGGRDLSAAERAPLVVDGEGEARRLRHPNLGFSVGLPADLEPLPASVTAAMTKEPGMIGTAWGNAAAGRVLIVMLSTVRSEAELRSFMEGMTDSQNALAKSSPGAAVHTLRDELSWSGKSGEAHRHVTIGDSHVHFDAFGSPYAGGRVLTVGLYTFSRGDDSLAELASTLRPH